MVNHSHLEPLIALPPVEGEYFIVCGLGRLGQHCVKSLKTFAQSHADVTVVAIDRRQPDAWEIDQVPDLLAAELVTGDCRQDTILVQAGIHQCRAILIVTSDENVNIETAIAARRLNPTVRLIVRSGKQNLNQLLKEKLGNFAAFDPIELPAESFTLAALGASTLGMFKVGDRQLRIVRQRVKPGDLRFENLPVHKLHKQNCRLLQYGFAYPAPSPPSKPDKPSRQDFNSSPFKLLNSAIAEPNSAASVFYRWPTDTRINAGDTLTYIETVEPHSVSAQDLSDQSTSTHQRKWFKQWEKLQWLRPKNWRKISLNFWNWVTTDRTRKVTALGLVVAFCLGVLGAVLLKFTVAGMTWQGAISSTIVLLLGGFGDVFGGIETTIPIPWWVQMICLFITGISILFVLSVLGLLADRLLSARFEFLRRRPPIPQSNHVVLVGLGRVGQRIATLLYEYRQPFVCLTQEKEQQDFMPQVPLIYSPIAKGLSSVNLAQAKSLIVATDDQMLNLEVALTARQAASQVDRSLNLIIRAQDQRFCDHLTGLLPDAKALCIYALSAEAFAGAAFGENILGLFRLANQTILVTEYRIESKDTLDGKLLAQVAYGYDVVPIAYQAQAEPELKLMPSDDIRLHEGDRLVVLATIQSLQKIEWGTSTPSRRWQLQAHKPLNAGAIYYAGNALENISGCELSKARAFMEHLPDNSEIPAVMELSLYDQQAAHLLRKLRKLLPVKLIPLE